MWIVYVTAAVIIVCEVMSFYYTRKAYLEKKMSESKGNNANKNNKQM